jgi:hypothetical protein
MQQSEPKEHLEDNGSKFGELATVTETSNFAVGWGSILASY